jgi:hypothetical protein
MFVYAFLSLLFMGWRFNFAQQAWVTLYIAIGLVDAHESVQTDSHGRKRIWSRWTVCSNIPTVIERLCVLVTCCFFNGHKKQQ